jgi:hypothetical protein
MVNMEHGQGTGMCCKAQHEKKTRSWKRSESPGWRPPLLTVPWAVPHYSPPFYDPIAGGIKCSENKWERQVKATVATAAAVRHCVGCSGDGGGGGSAAAAAAALTAAAAVSAVAGAAALPVVSSGACHEEARAGRAR